MFFNKKSNYEEIFFTADFSRVLEIEKALTEKNISYQTKIYNSHSRLLSNHFHNGCVPMGRDNPYGSLRVKPSRS